MLYKVGHQVTLVQVTSVSTDLQSTTLKYKFTQYKDSRGVVQKLITILQDLKVIRLYLSVTGYFLFVCY